MRLTILIPIIMSLFIMGCFTVQRPFSLYLINPDPYYTNKKPQEKVTVIACAAVKDFATPPWQIWHSPITEFTVCKLPNGSLYFMQSTNPESNVANLPFGDVTNIVKPVATVNPSP